MESKSKWIIFNKKGKRVSTQTLTHTDGRHYLQLEPFEQDLKKKGLYAQRAECFEKRSNVWNQYSFKKKLETMGWKFNQNGDVIADW